MSNDILSIIEYYKTLNSKLLDKLDNKNIFNEIKDIDYIKEYFLTFDNNLIDTVFDGNVYDKLYKIFQIV